MSVYEDSLTLKVNIKHTEKGIVVDPVETSTQDESNLPKDDNKTAILNLKEDAEIKFTILHNPDTSINVNSITSLSLSSCNLEYLPDSIGELQLVKLNLSRNKFNEVPYFIYEGLNFLECLDLSHNYLKEFDYQPKCVIRLLVLNLSNNCFVDLPSWILQVRCFNLEELYFNSNDVTSFKRSKFYCISSYRLRVLEIKNCNVRCEDVNFFKHIRSLKSLDLGNDFGLRYKYNCFANGESIGNLFNKPRWDDSLKVLKLTNLGVAYIPDEIKHLVSLEELYLAHNKIGSLPKGINSLSKLLVLDVSYNEVTSLSLNGVSLKVLKAPFNDISEINLNGLDLRSLDLYCNYIHDFNLESTSSLQKLDVEQNCFNTDTIAVSNYAKLKESLRLKTEKRLDGIREDKYIESDNYSDESSDFEDDCKNGGVEGEFMSGEVEEVWDVDVSCELPDNGCTPSDNEWTGSVQVYVKSKKRTKLAPLDPSSFWLFEDAL